MVTRPMYNHLWKQDITVARILDILWNLQEIPQTKPSGSHTAAAAVAACCCRIATEVVFDLVTIGLQPTRPPRLMDFLWARELSGLPAFSPVKFAYLKCQNSCYCSRGVKSWQLHSQINVQFVKTMSKAKAMKENPELDVPHGLLLLWNYGCGAMRALAVKKLSLLSRHVT